MCGVCGCSQQHDTSAHHHNHNTRLIPIEEELLAENNRYAEQNRAFFNERNILALNIMSSPGSGKTTLLAKTAALLKPSQPVAVIVGDQQTDADANVLQASGLRALQINTGKVCHLDAHMLGHALEDLPLDENTLLLIENIGNLVCPALFPLGEQFKIVILSVTEGENKPLKYPDMFRMADLVLITKTDLLPYLDFNLALCESYIHQIQPKAKILKLSSKNSEGMAAWLNWLNDCLQSPHVTSGA